MGVLDDDRGRGGRAVHARGVALVTRVATAVTQPFVLIAANQRRPLAALM